MSKWTHREFKLRLAWVDEQWNKPNRTDHYLMQIAVEVQRVLAKNPNSIQLENKKITFSKTKDTLTHENAEERARKSKMRWGPLLAQATRKET